MKPTSIIIVGAGGTGSYLIPPLVQYNDSFIKAKMYVYDPDIYEPSNLNRQAIYQEDIGRCKAKVMAHRYGIEARPHKFDLSEIEEEEFVTDEDSRPLFISCADNHEARLACIDAADSYDGLAIICGNETIDAEAYIYKQEWVGHPDLDPRIYYPDLLESESQQSVAPVLRCNSPQAIEKDPQLVVANHHSATFALHLVYYWCREQLEFPLEYSPHRIMSSSNGFRAYTATAGHARMAGRA